MKKLLFVTALLSAVVGYAQNSQGGRTCGTQLLPQQFELWVNTLMNQQSNGPKGGGSNNIQSVYNIPVIVHIIHNNESVNSVNATNGNNLNAAQVIDQINILNEDFNGLNADTSSIPAVFKPSLGKFQVNFCLAVVNPTGGILAEPGIDRINRVAKGWNSMPYTQTYIDATVKPNSIWDPNKYLNIWVCPLSNNILGYATFPNPGASGLAGLSAPYGSSTSDGVVILNSSFGSIGTAQFGVYNLGRTATHEIGHWMGLRHIWGDGNCASDYCNDTPPAQTANFGCQSYPYKLGVCTGNTTGEMTMNYMDYADDACMYMFTKDQKIRAQLILTFSTMRAALATSTVCSLPTIGLDAGISSVSKPTYTQNINCNNYVDPVLNITNYGSTVLSSLTVAYNVDGINTQTTSWTGSVNPSATFTLGIPQITGLGNGAHIFNATLTAINGGSDAISSNNTNMQNFTISNQMSITITSPTLCAGVQTTLTATGATTYTWVGIGTGSAAVISPTAATVYTLNVANSSCSSVRTVSVVPVNGPNLTVSGTTLCAGLPATVSAAGASTYTWNTGSNASSLSLTSSSTTVYSVSGNNPGNICTTTRTVAIVVLPSPTLTANSQTICAGNTATLLASGASSYTWDTGSTSNNASVTVSPLSTSVYTITGQVGTCVMTRTISVTIGSQLSLFISPQQPTICLGNNQSLSVSGATSYSWSTGSTNTSVSVNPSTTSVYTVSGSNQGCNGTQVVTVVVNQLPLTTVSTTNALCFGGNNGMLSASSTGNGPFVYAYSSGPNNLTAGIYTVITTDANGCISSVTAAITQPSMLVSSMNVGNTSCPAACNATAQLNGVGGTAPYTFTVYPGALVGSALTNLCAGNFNYFVTDANGCTGTGNFAVTAGNAGVNVNTSATNVSCSGCTNATITAQVTNGTAPYSYTWTPGTNFSNTYIDVAEGCYTVTAKDALGCTGEAEVCVSFDVGIKTLEQLKGIAIVPNPTSGAITLSGLTTGATVQVFDASGKMIRNTIASGTLLELSISDCSEGIYLIRVVDNTGSNSTRLIKY